MTTIKKPIKRIAFLLYPAFIIAVLMFAMINKTYAQNYKNYRNNPPTYSFTSKKNNYKRPANRSPFEHKYRLGSNKYKRMRNVGIGLTVAGSAVIIGGIIYSIPKMQEFQFDGNYDVSAVQPSTWTTLTVGIVAAGVTLVGITTWTVGSVKMKGGKYAHVRMRYDGNGATCMVNF
jgi:hypothetical protein